MGDFSVAIWLALCAIFGVCINISRALWTIAEMVDKKNKDEPRN